MPKRAWIGAFAIGLVFGWVLFPFIGLVLYYTNPPSDNAPENISEYEQGNYSTHDDQQNLGLGLWKWSGHWIESGDTLAQWIMMVFAIIAAALLLWTLFATLKMAKDTREIGEAQVRSYLALKEVFYNRDSVVCPHRVVRYEC